MREILFKAKTINGEWVEGFYWASLDPCSEQTKWRGHYIHNGCNIESPIKVDPETLCQFTEQLDKNNEKVFEGDRLFCNGVEYKLVRHMSGCYELYEIDKNGIVSTETRFLHLNRQHVEVKGNIHDK